MTELVKQAYSRVETMEMFLCRLMQGSEAANYRKLKFSKDSQDFREFLEETLVCTPKGKTELTTALSSSQGSAQSEVLCRVIQRLKTKGGSQKNLLTLGFGQMSDNPSAQISSYSDIEYIYPNQNFSRLQCEPWITLLSRIGDDIMVHMLETRSVFLPLKSGCFLQVTGTPMYDLSIDRKYNKSDHPKVCKIRKQKKKRKGNNLKLPKLKPKWQVLLERDGKLQTTVNITENTKLPLVCSSTAHVVDQPDKQPCYQNRSRDHKVQVDSFVSGIIVKTRKRKREASENTLCIHGSSMKKKKRVCRSEAFVQENQSTEQSEASRIPDHNSKVPGDDSSRPHVRENQELKKSVLFYAKDLQETFPTGYLTRLFRQGSHKVAEDAVKSEFVLPKLVAIIEKMIRNIRTSKVVFGGYFNTSKLKDQSVQKLLEQWSSNTSVFMFVKKMLKEYLPTELFGSKSNQNQFYKGVRKFIGLSMYQKFYIGDLLNKLKTSHIPWFPDGLGLKQQRTILSQMFSWVYGHIVMGLLKSRYYITEVSAYRNRVFYYRKKLWKIIHEKALNDFLQRGKMRPISDAEVEDLLTSKKSLGVSPMRFIPKASSLRPIILMTKAAGGTHRNPKRAVNPQLKGLLSILRYHKQQDPDLLGSAVYSQENIYQAWSKFVNNRKTANDNRPLYFVKVDIQGCFDSINQHKLFSIIKEILSKNQSSEYITRRFATVLTNSTRVRKQFHRTACVMHEYHPNFYKFALQEIDSNSLYNNIFIDQVLHDHDNKSDLLKKLEALLFGNIVKVGRQHYVQTEGIAQGSIVSTLLCGFYCGQMEKHHLTLCANELLLCQVDDFLFVTPSKENAHKFIQIMTQGIGEFGFRLNPKKTLTNLPDQKIDAEKLPEGALFSWCGILFDTRTLEARVDYMRYSGLSMQETLTVETRVKPGEALAQKLHGTLGRRCCGIYFDYEINNLPVLAENLFKVFLITAFQFHCFIKSLHQASLNIPFLMSLITNLPWYFKKCLRKIRQGEKFPISRAEINWLCYKAFTLKLEVHKAIYSKLIKRLKHQLHKMKDISKVVHGAALTMPEDFQGIMD